MPLTGWLMGRYGVVRTFVVSVVLFTIASFLCGVAWSLPSLVFFRVLQGGVSGPMIPGSQALLISIFPPTEARHGAGHLVDHPLVGADRGPILGGYISDNYHWGWIFLINVPVGIVCTVLSCWVDHASRETPTRKLPIDTVGPDPAGRLGGRAAGGAGPGQGRGLVQLQARSSSWPSSPRSASSPG